MASTYIERLNLTQGKILEALATYQFLTISQMIQLGIMKDRSNLNKQLKALSKPKKALIQSAAFGTIPSIGRLESIHSLTKYGKVFLEEELGFLEDIKYPKGAGRPYDQDYFHRKYTIDFQITLQQWIEKLSYQLIFFDRYFDKVGNNRIDKNLRAKTKVVLDEESFLIPDAIFMLELDNGNQELYCFEMYNGRNVKRTITQLNKHVKLFEKGALSEQFHFPYLHTVVCVFENESLMKSVIHHMKKDNYFLHMRAYFLMKTREQINVETLFSDWLTGDGLLKNLHQR